MLNDSAITLRLNFNFALCLSLSLSLPELICSADR